MDLWGIIIGFLAKMFAEMFGVALNTKKEEVHVETTGGVLDCVSTSTDALLDKYSRV